MVTDISRRMPAVTIRKLSPETHRALKARARGHGRSTEAEIRAILDAAVKPAEGDGIGSALAKLGRRFRGIELDIGRDPAPARPMCFE
jgi:plasmid stability protein